MGVTCTSGGTWGFHEEGNPAKDVNLRQATRYDLQMVEKPESTGLVNLIQQLPWRRSLGNPLQYIAQLTTYDMPFNTIIPNGLRTCKTVSVPRPVVEVHLCNRDPATVSLLLLHKNIKQKQLKA